MKLKKWILFTCLFLFGGVLIGQSATNQPGGSRVGYPVRSFRLEMDGTPQKGILQIVEFTPYKSGLRGMANDEAMAVQRVFTRYVTPPFKIIRTADYDEASRLNRWVEDSLRARNAGADPASKARNLDIILLKGTEEKLTFHVKGAWISEISYSDLDRAAAGKLKETLIIESSSIDPTF